VHTFGGDEAAALRHDDEERGLAEVGAFAAHVGAGDEEEAWCARRAGGVIIAGAEVEGVGDEATGALVFEAALDYGVSGGDEF
jgi:hypothetical protein